jgi:hypothetical protein
MKGSRILLWLVLCAGVLTGGEGYSQQAEVIDQVKEAIKAGSAKELSKYLHQTIDVTIEG